MYKSNEFIKNVERWMLFCPEAIELLQLNPTQNDLGPSKVEAAEWASKLDYHSFKLLYVYGIGTYAPYSSLKEWCKQKDHFLVILEDNLEAIAHFFKTEEAAELLYAENIWLYYLDPTHAAIQEITKLFPEIPYTCATLYSEESKLKTFKDIIAKINFYTHYYNTFVTEQSSYGITFYHNFFSNLFLWPTVFSGDALFEKFNGIPAIICGAGPSLAKNIEVLKTLKEKALIFAGGTALNALNSAGMNPHFGVGIDPNPEQVTRIIMNSGFEVPFLYRSRMNREALNLVHNDKFYVSGANGYEIPKYFEEKCGIESHVIDEGCNVINFSLSLAFAMGCNPIFVVGVDLAYSNDQSYAPGMQHHPIHRHFRTKYETDELIYRNDIYGNSVPTLWKWVTESIWFSNFATMHPTIKFINCTEGGIGFINVPNMPLSEAAEQFLSQQHGVGCRIYGAIAQSKMNPLATKEHLYTLFDEMGSSLTETEVELQQYGEELIKIKEAFNFKDAPPTNEEFKKNLQEKLKEILQDKKCYPYLLEGLNLNFEAAKQRQFQRLILDYNLLKPIEWQLHLLELEQARILYLQKGASVLNILMQQVTHERKIKDRSDALQINNPIDPPTILGTYSFENNLLVMHDPECGLNISEEFIPDPASGVYKLTDDEGHVTFESYRKEGRLHGPTRYYGRNHFLAAEHWYLEGKQVGKAVYYFSPHAVHAILRFKDGLQEGRQDYYYDDQTPKMIIENYSKGLLDGTVYLFHPNGLLARKLQFKEGKREGTELLWSAYGILIMEANFSKGKPIGISKVWSAEGKLIQEIFYNEASEIVNSVQWDQLGNLTKKEQGPKRDYFQEVATNTQVLTQNLSQLHKEMLGLKPLLEGMHRDYSDSNDVTLFIQELAGIGEAIKGLQETNEKLLHESGFHLKNQGETFWKTSSLQKEVQAKLENASKQMQADLAILNENLYKTIFELSRKSKDGKDDKDSKDEKDNKDDKQGL